MTMMSFINVLSHTMDMAIYATIPKQQLTKLLMFVSSWLVAS